MIDTIAPAPVGFSWVNYDSTSIVTRDDEDVSIIKSHAMRVVHRERHKNARATGISPKKKLAAICRPKGGSADSMMWKSRRNPFLYEPEQLRTDWESLAICAFMDDFVYPQVSPDTAYQFLNFLPGLYNRYSQSSSLTKAISAVALARFANQKQAAGLASLAHKAYTSALTTVNESMKDPILRRSDNFLTTLILLTKYEMVCGDALVDDTWQLHDRGQAALILQRGDDYLRTEIGGALFRLIYTRQCLNCIARRHKPTISMTSGSWQLAFPTAYFRKTMKLVASIADLVYDAYSHSPPCGTAPNESCRVADDAVRMDAELTAFMTQILPCMEYDRIPNDVHREKDFEEGYSPKSLNVFRDLQLASLHHIFWYGRLHVLQIILQYSNYQLKWQREELQARLQETVDHICESVPYALGDTDCPKVTLNAKGGKAVAAHYLVWVLAAASIAPGVPIAQKEWISQRLKHIGHVHGLQQALVFA